MSVTPELFVGRIDERRMFQNSVHAILAPPGQRAKAPDLFIIHGEHGTGKSALLRQFAQIARASGVEAARTLALDLAGNEYNTARDLAAALAAPLRQLSGRALATYDDLLIERLRLEPRYGELHQQWERWQMLQSFGPRALEGLLDQHYGTQQQAVVRHTLFGAGFAPTHAASQLERAIEDVSWILQFRTAHNRSPNSFDELLDWALKASAALFRDDARFGSVLAGTLNQLAVRAPLVLLIDGYEHADAHDDWLRGMFGQLSNQILVAVAGRRRMTGAYAHGKLAERVAIVDANLPLDDDDVRLYLAKRLGLASTNVTPLIDEVITIAQGVPLALAALGDQLANGGSLAPFRDLPNGMAEPDGYQRALLARFFTHVLGSAAGGAGSPQIRQHDRQRLRVMALLRPDAELLAAGWGLSGEETRKLDGELAERYGFIFHGSLRFSMQPLAREVAQADARAARKRPTEWQAIASGLQRAHALVEERIRQLEAVFATPAARYAQPDWRRATLDQLHLLLWLGQHEQARNLLLNHWVEARYQSPAFADWLLERAAAMAPRGGNWPPILAALQTGDYDLLSPHVVTLPTQTQATLGYLRARRLPLPTVSAKTVAALDRRIVLLKTAYAQAPDWLPVSSAYAEALSARGHYQLYARDDYAAAIADFTALIELDPEYRAAYSRRGFAHHALGNYRAAIEDWNQALAVQPDSGSARFGRAAALTHLYEQQRWQAGRQAVSALLDSAHEDLDLVIAEFPNDHIARYYRGLICYWRGEPAHAVSDLRVACALEPTRAASHSALGLAWAALAKQAPELWLRAVNTAQLACMLAPDDPGVLANRGLISFFMDQPIDAVGYFDQALVLRPDHAPTLFLRSRAHLQVGDLRAAQDDITHALAQQPEYPDFYALRAEITLRQADSTWGAAAQQLIQQATTDSDHALQLRPNDPTALAWRAHAAALESNLTLALADVTQAMSFEASMTHGYAVRGSIRQQQAERAEPDQQAQAYAEALNDLNAALVQNDEWAETFARRGLVLHALGQHEDAVADFDRALAIRQNDPHILFWRGKAQQYDSKKLDNAKQNFDDSLKVLPKQPDVLYARGCLLLASNDPTAAIRDFEALLRLRPGDPRAVAKLAEAKRRTGDMIGAMPHYWTQVSHWTRDRFARQP